MKSRASGRLAVWPVFARATGAGPVCGAAPAGLGRARGIAAGVDEAGRGELPERVRDASVAGRGARRSSTLALAIDQDQQAARAQPEPARAVRDLVLPLGGLGVRFHPAPLGARPPWCRPQDAGTNSAVPQRNAGSIGEIPRRRQDAPAGAREAPPTRVASSKAQFAAAAAPTGNHHGSEEDRRVRSSSRYGAAVPARTGRPPRLRRR